MFMFSVPLFLSPLFPAIVLQNIKPHLMFHLLHMLWFLCNIIIMLSLFCTRLLIFFNHILPNNHQTEKPLLSVAIHTVMFSSALCLLLHSLYSTIVSLLPVLWDTWNPLTLICPTHWWCQICTACVPPQQYSMYCTQWLSLCPQGFPGSCVMTLVNLWTSIGNDYEFCRFTEAHSSGMSVAV